jgi:hypothetical protein
VQIYNSKYNDQPNAAYIVVVYSYLISFTLDTKLVNKILSVIRKKVGELHFHFQRQVKINIYGKFVTGACIDLKKRQMRAYNNQLIKLLMSTGNTTDPKRKAPVGDMHIRQMKLKIAKYG